MPPTIERTLLALTRHTVKGADKSQRNWAFPGIRFGGCDDGRIAADPAGNAAGFDGRIDNCDELGRALGSGHPKRRDNAEIALSCYEKWGDDLYNHLIGDYACTIWDAQRRRLVMAVDPGALRPLYYWLGAGEILFASEQRGLLADPRVARALDEARLRLGFVCYPRSAAHLLSVAFFASRRAIG